MADGGSIFRVVSTFTGTGPSEPVSKRAGEPLDVSVSGGSGVVDVEWFKNEQWEAIKTITIDQPDAVTNARGGNLIRLNCTTFTTGPIKYTLG